MRGIVSIMLACRPSQSDAHLVFLEAIGLVISTVKRTKKKEEMISLNTVVEEVER